MDVCRGALVYLCVALMSASSAEAQAVASVLELASPASQRAVYQPLQVAVGPTGREMIVYKAHAADGEPIVPVSIVRDGGGAWQSASVPMPELGRFASTLHLAGLAGDPAGGFHLVGSHYGNVFYWHWSAGTWSQPEQLAAKFGGLSAVGVSIDARGEPLVVYAATRFHCVQRRNGAWQEVKLPLEIAQHNIPPVVTDLQGAVHLLGLRRGVPQTAALAADADPLVEGDWQSGPGGDLTTWSTALPLSSSSLEAVLDWPRQMVFATWVERRQVKFARAPLGAVTDAAWTVDQIPAPAGNSPRYARLVSNGQGGVGLLVYVPVADEPVLSFHWIGPTGPGPAIPLLRPGTQTEAAVFRSMNGEHMNFAVDAAGVAHVAICATKRGEVPANTPRLFYATVSGGGTATSGPAVTGHGTTTMQQQGPPPDFTIRIVDPDGAAAAARRSSYNHAEHHRLRPQVEVTNQGAEYYGDLVVRADIDGATAVVRMPDTSNHTRPLFTRGQARKLWLGEVDYTPTPIAGDEPPSASWDVDDAPPRFHLGTGLGRKTMTVTVDPDHAITEENEENNQASVEYIVGDGRDASDREKLSANDTVRGMNDLAAGPLRLRSNTQLIRAGYVQRPTQLDTLATNPRRASFFAEIDAAVYLDGAEYARRSLGRLQREPNLVSRLLGTAIFYDPTPPKPDLSGHTWQVPIDLTDVAEGQHRLKLVVDPDDRFADRALDNNTAELDFRVRPPGGTLRVQVRDLTGTHAPIAGAMVTLTDLWVGWTDAQGQVTIPDAPAGSYNAGAVTAERSGDEPRFYPGAAPSFQVASGQEVTVDIALEHSLTIAGRVLVAGTGQVLTDEQAQVALVEDDNLQGGRCTNGDYTIADVAPGPHHLVAGAYGYANADLDVNAVRQGQTDTFTADLTLTPLPRGTVTGQVVDQDNHPLAGAVVWLARAPRAAETGADGTWRLDGVAAGLADTVWAQAKDHTMASAELVALTGGETRAVAPLQLSRIRRQFKSIDFNATTYALCEETAAAGEISAIKVETKFGAFSGALGLGYHQTAGQPVIHADHLFLWLEGGTFIQGGVSSSIGIDDLTGVSLDTLKVGPMGDLLTGYGRVFQAIDGVNKLADFLYGDLDPSQLHRNNEITATYISHTGTEPEQQPLINIPTSTDIPVAVTFAGGGTTVVRVDILAVKDGNHPEKRLRPEWYSPGFCAFAIDRDFDLATLEVELFVAVLNSRLQTGVLGNTSRNRILWKPNQNKWLRIEGYQYELTY